jgi:DNA-binding transcriptional regulator YiaG
MGRPAPAYQPTADDWRRLRAGLGLSQSQFAARLATGGITVRAVQAYEQGERAAHPAIWRYALAQVGGLAMPE